MAETENTNANNINTSFGRLLLTFLMISLLALFIISLLTSEKIKESNEKKLEQYLAAKLDKIISGVFLYNYVRNSLQNLISEFKKNGTESKKLADLEKECEEKDKLTFKCFFYKDLELKQNINAEDADLDFFKNFMKQLQVKITDNNYLETYRITLKNLIKYFGDDGDIRLLKIAKGLYAYFSTLDKRIYLYWDIFDNGLGIFLFTTKVPSLEDRFRITTEKYKDRHFGYISSNKDIIVPPIGFTEDQILQATKIISKSNKPFIILKNHYCYFQKNRFEDIFCYVLPLNNNENNYIDWVSYVQNTAAIIFIITVILYITSLIPTFPGKNLVNFLDNTSIKYRLIGLFSMASVFPVLMTAIIGHSLLIDKQRVIEENIQSESLNLIYKMENQKEVLINKILTMCNEMREVVKERYLANKPIDLHLFYQYLDKYSIFREESHIEIEDNNLNAILSMEDPEQQSKANLYELLARVVIKLHCPEKLAKEKLNVSPSELITESILATDELGLATLINQRKKIVLASSNGTYLTWYWDVYPELASGPAFISITENTTLNFTKHIKDYIFSLPKNPNNIQLSVLVNNFLYSDKIITPYTNLPNKNILDIANTAYDTNNVLFRTINIDGKPYWITAKHEKKLNRLVFINLVSQKERLEVLEPFKWQIVTVGLFTLIISLVGAWFITNLIIIPIGDLSNGIIAIRQRNKEFNIPVRRKDEFGELATAFNKVISEFEELEYGKIVQESLLPAKAPEISGYDIAYYTISATDLAGDYHDNVLLEDGRISIILGDVSGHGISASLAMAMAKATFNYAKAQKVKFPEEFMDMANIMFNKELKPRNKLMTLISMVLTPETGEVTFDNAGQAYPAYYTASSNTTEEIKMPSLPLGGMKKRKRKPVTKIMEEGDAFILYTDGIIEASAADGEMFGYERFFSKFNEQMQLKKTSKEAIYNIFQAMDNFREPGPRSDDITMVVVKKLKVER